MIAPATITRYTKALQSLAKAFQAKDESFVGNHLAVIEWIENQDICISSKKVFLCALIYCIQTHPDLVLDMPHIFDSQSAYRERVRLYSAQLRYG